MHLDPAQPQLSEHHLRAVLALVTDGVVVRDRGGKVIAASKSAPALLALTDAQLSSEGTPPGWELRHEDGRVMERHELPGISTLQTGIASGPLRVRLHLPNGTLRHLVVHSEPIVDKAGALVGSVVSLRDVSDMRLADDERKTHAARAAAMLEDSDYGVFEVDLSQGSVARSLRIHRMLGIEPPELAGTVEAWLHFVHPGDLAALSDRWTRCKAGELSEFDMEYRVRHRSGRWIWVRALARTVRRTSSGQAQLVTGQLYDVTARREAEEALEAARQRITFLEERLQKLERASRE